MKRFLISLSLFPLLLAACTSTNVGTALLNNTHVHGLAVDRADSNRVFLATHHGLLAWQEAQGLTKVGGSRDDFMGFSVHPTDSQILFRSGHPAGGGNLGFQKSTDAGESWDTVNNGSPTGPVDFHTMTVHPVDPKHIYGWFGGRIHRSLDGGENWTIIPEQMSISSIAGDPSSDATVYVGTQNGLLMSTDRGETWTQVTAERRLGAVLDIEPDAATASLLLAMNDGKIVRLFRSPKDGWVMDELSTISDVPVYLALDTKNSKILYAFTETHALHRSVDGGKTWQKILGN